MLGFDLLLEVYDRPWPWDAAHGQRTMEYQIRQYSLQQGALEIQYIEEYFGEFSRRKTATEVIGRLGERDHQILMAEAPLSDDPATVVPVSYKVSHELRPDETDPKLTDLVARLHDYVEFRDRKVLYSWIGGTRRDWRGIPRRRQPRQPYPVFWRES